MECILCAISAQVRIIRLYDKQLIEAQRSSTTVRYRTY